MNLIDIPYYPVGVHLLHPEPGILAPSLRLLVANKSNNYLSYTRVCTRFLLPTSPTVRKEILVRIVHIHAIT